MSEINWIQDEAAIMVLGDIGLVVEDAIISVREIDRKASRENRARKIPLDESRIEGIKNAMGKGVPIPKIVVRKHGSGYVIAGGNHRFASVNGASELPAHVINDCTDREFEIACRILNTVVGEGMTRSERVESAVDAVSRMKVAKKAASKFYGVSESAIEHGIAAKTAQHKLGAMPLNVRKAMLKTHITQLGELGHNDNILRAAANLVAETKMTAKELGELARVARTKSTEAQQVGVFEEQMKLSVGDANRTIPRPLRKKLMSAMSAIQSLKGSQSWSSVEVGSSEIDIFRNQAREVISILNCLLRDAG